MRQEIENTLKLRLDRDQIPDQIQNETAAITLECYDQGFSDGAKSRDEEINQLKTQLMMQLSTRWF